MVNLNVQNLKLKNLPPFSKCLNLITLNHVVHIGGSSFARRTGKENDAAEDPARSLYLRR